MNKRGVLTVISGFSGSGKGTVVKKLVEEHNYVISVSATTRKPRPGEINGVHYFFESKEQFEERIKQDGFLEYATFVENSYGTPVEYVDKMLDEGKDVILEIEVNGGLLVKKKRPDTIMIFMVPPSADELKRRLEGRGTEAEDVINKRLAQAARESLYIGEYSYLVINDEVDECVTVIDNIIKNEKRKIIFNNDLKEKVVNDYKRFNTKGDI